MNADKFLVIEGRVIGGHNLGDLGVTVPYKGEVTLNYDRASWSRDLNHAIQNGMVIKKRVISGHDNIPRATPAPVRPHREVPVVQFKPRPTEVPQAPGDVQLSKENEDLRDMNKQLLEVTKRLMEQQNILMEKMSSFVDRAPQQVYIPQTALQSTPNPVVGGGDDEIEEDIPTFIPSQIRSGKAKTSAGMEVAPESKDGGDQFNKAAEALKAMRGTTSNRRKKRDSDD